MFAAAVFALASPICLAEAPMNTDDAGALGQGGYKIEFEWAREGSVRGPTLGFGFAPVENLEIGLGLGRSSDRSTIPSPTERATSVAFKWVPLKWGETTAGLKLELSNARPDGGPQVRENTLTALLTHRYDGGHAVHMNLGHAVSRPRGGASQSTTQWSLGGEWAFAPTVSLTGGPVRRIRSRWPGPTTRAALARRRGRSSLHRTGPPGRPKPGTGGGRLGVLGPFRRAQQCASRACRVLRSAWPARASPPAPFLAQRSPARTSDMRRCSCTWAPCHSA